jgi:hypothetical protein
MDLFKYPNSSNNFNSSQVKSSSAQLGTNMNSLFVIIKPSSQPKQINKSNNIFSGTTKYTQTDLVFNQQNQTNNHPQNNNINNNNIDVNLSVYAVKKI